jgi:hypothetical protein
MDVLTTAALSTGELYSLLPNDDVTSKANDLLLECTRWAMGQDAVESTWLTKFFGEQPPVLGPAQKALAVASLSWYQQHFAKAYLSWTVANYDGPFAPSVRLEDDQRLKLKYYLQTGLAKDADYSKQQLGLYGAAFLEVKPRLQAYVDDGGEKWAQAFYAEVSADTHLTLLINSYFLTGSGVQLNNYSALLNALQPSGTLAMQLQHLVVTGTIAQVISDAKLSADNSMPWLGDYLEKFLNKIAENASLIPEDAFLAVQQAKEFVNSEGGGYAKVAQAMFDLMANSGGHSILSQAKFAENAFAEAHPRFAKAGGLIMMAAWAGGFFYVLSALKGWKDLDPQHRTDVVVALVDFSAQAVLGVPELLLGAKASFSAVLEKMQSWFVTEPGRNGMLNLMRADGVHELAGAEDPLLQSFGKEAQAAQAAKIEGTVWERVFPKASKAVSVVGAACAVYFAYRSTQDFLDDLRSHSVGTEQKAYDGVIMAANFGAAVCLTLDIAMTTTFIPIAGAILAVVGIIVAIIEAHRVSPPNPLDDFMRDMVIPFVRGLKPQDAPPSAVATS